MEKSYEERQRECGLKVGDKVKLLRGAEDGESGWGDCWMPKMSRHVGDIGVVEDTRETSGIFVKMDEENGYWFPYFVLEKVEDKETPKHVEPVKQEEKKLTNYSVFTTNTEPRDFFLITAISKEENNESIIFTEENGGTWEFYKKHIVAIKKA